MRSESESLYGHLPPFLQTVACSLAGWNIQRRRYSRTFFTYLSDAEARSQWSTDRVIEHRDERLRRFLSYATAHFPYYEHLFKQQHLDPKSVRKLEDLSLLPILTKAHIRENRAKFRPLRKGKHRLVKVHTSGTTGAPLQFHTTLSAAQEQWAIWWRYRRWHGLDLGTWCAYFGGRSIVPVESDRGPLWRTNLPGRQILFSAYHMSRSNFPAYLEELRRRKPPWLHGYPSLIAALAGYILESNADLGYEVKWITLGAENLLDQQAQLIERAFGRKPLQHYGTAEAVANASECEKGALHIDEDFSAVELIRRSDGTVSLVGTNFTNINFPMIRYEIEDVAMREETGCSCGKPGRVLARIDGRLEDYIVLRNGSRIGRLDHIFKDLTNIREAQLVQSKVGEVTIRLQVASDYGAEDENMLLRESRRRLGNDTKIELEYVSSIPRTPSGKLRFVVSQLREGHLIEREG